MQLHQFRTDGHIDVTEVSMVDIMRAKRCAIVAVANPEASGVFRAQLVDEAYMRVAWDTYFLDATDPAVGTIMFFGCSA